MRAKETFHVQAKVGRLLNKVGVAAVIDDGRAREEPNNRATEGAAAENDGVVVVVRGGHFVRALGGKGRELHFEVSREPGAKYEGKGRGTESAIIS